MQKRRFNEFEAKASYKHSNDLDHTSVDGMLLSTLLGTDVLFDVIADMIKRMSSPYI